MKAKGVAKIAGWIALGIAAATALAFVMGLVVQALWNWLMPALFGLPEVTYWQGIGLLVLCHLLFKSHMGHGGPHGGDKLHGDTHFFKAKVLDMLGEKEASGEGANETH